MAGGRVAAVGVAMISGGLLVCAEDWGKAGRQSVPQRRDDWKTVRAAGATFISGMLNAK
jgi:hypothetical protein